MKYKLKVYSIWEFGQRKDAEGNPHQEDSLYPAFGKATEADRTFILCDGMGGHDAGEVASATVCETMGETIRNNGHDAEGVFTDDDLKAAIAAAFDALDQKDSGAEKKMGTTMTFLKLHNEGATIAHIGDSRVYHIRPGKTGEDTQILHETEDHSLVNDLVKIGELTREEARFSKQKNVITRAMQPNLERRPKADIFHVKDIRPGDYFYMCSDGMLEQPDMEDGSVLKRIFSALGETDERRVEILRGATNENRDNHTAFVIRIEEVTDPVIVAEPPVAPAACAAVVEDDIQQTKEKKPCKNHAGHSPFILKVFVAAAIVALCFLGFWYIGSCSPAPAKEQVETPVKQPARREGKPAKPVRQPVQTPARQPIVSEAGQPGADEPAATPAEQQPQGNVLPAGSSAIALPANLDGNPQEEIPSSDQQMASDAFNKQ